MTPEIEVMQSIKGKTYRCVGVVGSQLASSLRAS